MILLVACPFPRVSGRHAQGLAAVPARTVECERNMLIGADRGGERPDQRLLARAVRIGQDQCERIVGAGLERRVDVDNDVALTEKSRRPLAALPPDVAGAVFLSDTRLVQEEQPQSLVFACMLYFSQGSQGSF
jgi:hypothetical protein